MHAMYVRMYVCVPPLRGSGKDRNHIYEVCIYVCIADVLYVYMRMCMYVRMPKQKRLKSYL